MYFDISSRKIKVMTFVNFHKMFMANKHCYFITCTFQMFVDWVPRLLLKILFYMIRSYYIIITVKYYVYLMVPHTVEALH